MNVPLLAVEEVTKFYPQRRAVFGRRRPPVRALDGVSFTLARGESLGLVGESGAGKSTLGRLVVGLERPTAGSIAFDGVELTTLSRAGWRDVRPRVQMVFQDPYAALDPRQTAGEIVSEPLVVHRVGKPRERRLHTLALLEAVGLGPASMNRYPHEFSGGQRQRIGIARALALEPELVVCDEPVSALDVSIRAQILTLLKELQQRFSLSYLFIAHDLSAVRALCTRIAVLYLGRVVELAPRAELFEAPRHPYTRALLSAVPQPDPEVERLRQRIVLPGDAPSPLEPPSGCAFHPRCTLAAEVGPERCRTETPELVTLGDGAHQVACHAFGPGA